MKLVAVIACHVCKIGGNAHNVVWEEVRPPDVSKVYAFRCPVTDRLMMNKPNLWPAVHRPDAACVLPICCYAGGSVCAQRLRGMHSPRKAVGVWPVATLPDG